MRFEAELPIRSSRKLAEKCSARMPRMPANYGVSGFQASDVSELGVGLDKARLDDFTEGEVRALVDAELNPLREWITARLQKMAMASCWWM